MAIKAVVSIDEPKADTTTNVIWSGALGVDGDEGVGLTTAAILGFFPEAIPGTWYSLNDFSHQVDSVNWAQHGADQWTSLEIQQDGPGGMSVVSVDVKLEDAVRSLCLSAVDLLSSFENKNIWVRFE
ncbi:hypothetical protein GFB56_33805 [Ensifer sp. T173]|uniref:Uncharacterized protein n=1 Tax=Ensifer canadensis TaxID=555315 RepID=A0AAW4FX36_9HYPH|nr:hypothetical protein [Ensifer canadensis]MBM3095687.1 hypothetical protein [Ensifer canadensis]UBI79961.1 hypothetical protein J3R84_30555 [Ensifer canadensis]